MNIYRSTVRRPNALPVLAKCILVAATMCVVAPLAAAVVLLRPTASRSPADTTATVGGLNYSVNDAWRLDPRRRVEARLASGLPSVDRRLGRRRLLYAVFVGVTNETDHRLPMAADFALRDTRNREYAATPLGRENAFAYGPRVMAPKTHRPAPWTAAGRDLATEGLMLVFRIPRRSYKDGPLELVVHDPLHPSSVRTIETA